MQSHSFTHWIVWNGFGQQQQPHTPTLITIINGANVECLWSWIIFCNSLRDVRLLPLSIYWCSSEYWALSLSVRVFRISFEETTESFLVNDILFLCKFFSASTTKNKNESLLKFGSIVLHMGADVLVAHSHARKPNTGWQQNKGT